MRSLFFLIPILYVCCTKIQLKLECTTQKLSEQDMIKYEWQDLECKTFLELYNIDGEAYYALNNHCADIIFRLVDCEGVELSNYNNYNHDKDFVSIVGFKP